jgi:hypothetical protein
MEDGVVEDWRWLCAEPDEIEQEIIRAVSAIPDKAENWIDDRPGIKRLIEKVQSDAHVLPALQERAIREKWTKEIAFRLVQLVESLKYTTYGSRGVGGPEGPYDVIWRDMAEWETRRVSLVLECNWFMGPSDNPTMKSLANLLIARAEHRAMVCQGSDAWGTFERLVSTVESSWIKRVGDRCLLLFFDRLGRKFESYVCVAGTFNKGGRKRRR